MKAKLLLSHVTAFVVIAACGNLNAASSDKPLSTPASAAKKAPATKSAEPGAEMVGEWEMAGMVVDTNDNLLIDDAERKALKQTMKDYMKLNRDRTGLFTLARMEGRYELTGPDSNGRHTLTWYDKANGRHRVGTIVKVTKDEMQIKEPGGHGLFLWKRI